MGKTLVVCVAATAVLSLSGCGASGNAFTDTNFEELRQRNFSEIVEATYEDNNDYYGGDYATYYANAGGCRVVLQFIEQPDISVDQWTLIEKSSKGEDSDVILPNPTAAKVGELDAFQHCYNEPVASTATPAP